MKTTVELDEQTSRQVAETVSLVGEEQETVLRMAIRAGLPLLRSSFEGPRPEGYFASAYENPRPEQLALEDALSTIKISPDR
jgi:hypothetical protein